ncbi:MAG: hypothetical protein KKB51_08445 [Candidatus Riflebacteria bacterium]|nr:hypothetical protein [Candidatus Riflebacteria bacterium]
MKKLFLLVVFMFFVTTGAFSQASLADGDQVDVTIKIDNFEENITCVKDALKPDQWYYVPNKPRLVVTKNTESREELPTFSLVKYQAPDPDNPQALIEGGVLQASINLALPPTGLNQLKEALSKLTGKDADKILIAPLSMNNAKIAVYTPGGDIMGTAPIAPDVGPSFANQSIPLQINLTNLGAGFTDALVKTNGGVLVTYIFDYNGLTPKCGFKITVDWQQAFHHFSSQTKTRESYGNWFWHGSVSGDVSKVRQELVTNKCITIESITGDAFKAEDMDAYMMPIIEAINKEIFNIEAPEKVDPATAVDPSNPSKSWGFSGGITFSMKDISTVKKEKTVYSMDRQSIVTRQTIAGGLIGLGNYSKAIQDKLIVTMPDVNWASSWYSLPDVGSSQDIGVEDISVTVKVLDDRGNPISSVPQQAAKWTAQTGEWRDTKNLSRTSLVFALQSTFEKYKGKEDKLSYYQKIDVTQKMGSNTIKKSFISNAPIVNGSAHVSTPMSNIECVMVSGDYLTWYGDNYMPGHVPAAFEGQPSDLTNVTITLTSSTPNNHVSGTISGKTTQLHMLLDRGNLEDVPLTKGTFVFNSQSHKKTIETKDLFKEMGTEIYLTDKEYLPAK